MKELLLHKIQITPEAYFDYEEDMRLGSLPGKDIIEQVETYLSIQQSIGRRLYRYQPIKYLDETTDTMLMLYVYRGPLFGIMQTWYIRSISLFSEYDPDEDEDGVIKSWYNTQIQDFAEQYDDWVLRLRERERYE